MSDVTVCDLHTDLLVELTARRELADPFGELWLQQLRDGGVRLQVCPIWVDPCDGPQATIDRVMRQAAAFHRAARAHADEVVVVRTREDVQDLMSRGQRGILLAMEGADCVAEDLDLLEVLWELGVRMVGPFWAGSNAFGDGTTGSSHGGLTPLGRELVARAAARGFIIDFAHATDASFAGMLEVVGDAPVIVSHAGCRAVHDIPGVWRNVSDEQLAQIRDRDGIVGILALPPFIDPQNASLDVLVDHIAHALGVAGEGCVGLGGDFMEQIMRAGLFEAPPSTDDPESAGPPPDMGSRVSIEGGAGPADYPTLLQRMRGRGMAERTVASVAGGAVLDFLSRSLPRPGVAPA